MRYRTSLEDSARWNEFRFRPGDIVISTPPKSGTTWMQMICALLVFQTTELPAPLTTLSPWLDLRLRPLPEVLEQLERQHHRRFIKTHTPLDGLPLDDRVTYVVVGRDPRDVAVSLHYQQASVGRGILRRSRHGRPATQGVRESVLAWMDSDDPPQRKLPTLKGLAWHITDVWQRRADPRVVIFHYQNLHGDLEGEMRRLASRLDIEVNGDSWPALVRAATLADMRERSDTLVPNEGLDLLTVPDNRAFFRSGSTGQWRQWLTRDDMARYERRVAALAAPDVAAWLHHTCLDHGVQPRC